MSARTASSHRGGVVLVLVAVLAVVVLCVAGYLAFVLNWSYSEGERAGVIQKISRKGWVCKTWEGELAMTTVPGVAPVIWNFSVRSGATAAQLSAVVGRHVVVHYREHRGIPTNCFGETNHFVDAVRVEREPPPEAQPSS